MPFLATDGARAVLRIRAPRQRGMLSTTRLLPTRSTASRGDLVDGEDPAAGVDQPGRERAGGLAVEHRGLHAVGAQRVHPHVARGLGVDRHGRPRRSRPWWRRTRRSRGPARARTATRCSRCRRRRSPNASSAARMPHRVPSRLTSTRRRTCSSVRSARAPSSPTPALLNHATSTPWRAAAAATSRCASGSRTSWRSASAAPISRAVAARRRRRRR